MSESQFRPKASRRRSPTPTLVSVAVLAALQRQLTYSVPNGLDVRIGQRVLVPLGSRRVTGVVLSAAPPLPPGVDARAVIQVLDSEPVLSPELLTLGMWIAEYYLSPLGEVFRAMLPLRPHSRKVPVVRLTEAGRKHLGKMSHSLLEETRQSSELDLLKHVADHPAVALEALRRKFQSTSPGIVRRAIERRLLAVSSVERERGERKVMAIRLAGPLGRKPPKLSPVARRIVEALDRDGEVHDHRELLKSTRGSLAHLRTLQALGLIEFADAVDDGAASIGLSEFRHTLTASQGRVLEDLTHRLHCGEFRTVLLHGITASGKTEIYMRLVERCLESGRTALILVPEIALTPAIHDQFRMRFGSAMAVLHSGLAEGQRHDAWWRVRRGEARVVLGTRSALFAPLENLGAIIVDEEHESSYKQDETPRYHARDTAVVRGRLSKALVVLGSATPSLESYANTEEGKYYLLTMSERVGRRPLASVEIIDMREEFRQTQTQTQVPISRRMREEVEAQLQSGQQTMFLLNRRGYSWFLLCRSCGQAEQCVNCSISLTYHRRENRLICHYCGYQASVPVRCRSCDSEYLYYVGEGTEKLEQKLAEMFPAARVARLDRDAARRPGQYLKILADFRDGKIDILVGTQMIAKGHDFPGVTLVGIVSADTSLSLPDFRAAERTFQLLTQAAGRAGRGESPGRVLVQTFYPEHYAIRLAAEQDYIKFFNKELHFRRMMHYPPAAALADVVVRDKKLEHAVRMAAKIGKFFESLGELTRGVRILGPGPAPLARIERYYRIQFLLKASSRSRLNVILRRLAEECDQLDVPSHALMIDMDPVNLM
ncbi:MAG: primosomal protein N' [Acidobacteria bacterium]|nr:MAG: primosomal protein N' [Acidobacteriota bacterium]